MQPYSPLTPFRYKRLFQYITRLPNLVAYYPMFEQEGTVARNYAPATKDTLNGTTTGATIGQAGQVGKAYSFDGSGDTVTIGDNDVLDITNEITLMAIVKPGKTSGINATMAIMSKRLTTPYSYGLYCGLYATDDTIPYFEFNDGAYKGGQGLSNLEVDAFSLVVATYDKVNVKIYINGILDKTTPFSSSLPSTSANLNIGSTNAVNNNFTGELQHAAIFNRALTQKEITRLFQISDLT